jgi:hypothetical protein
MHHQSHTIANLILKRGLSPSGESILVGVVLTNGCVTWGACGQLADIPAAINTLKQLVTPLLQDQPLHSFPKLVAQVDKLTETETQPRPVSSPLDPPTNRASRTISRRQLITGHSTEDTPEMEQVTITRPLSPSLRFGVSQAILYGIALSQHESLVTVLAEAFNTPISPKTIPLLVDAEKTNIAIIKPIIARAAAIGYWTGHLNHKRTLGSNAERLQAHVRQVKTWLMDIVHEAQLTIHLNIQGGFTDLYDNNAGKILGALYGLEQAAKPYALVIENIVMGDVTAVSDNMKQIQSYLDSRKMTVKLAAGYSLFPPAALKQFVADKALHQIHINLSQFGSILQTMAFIDDCKAQEINVILHDEGENVETATAVAQAAGVYALSGPSYSLYNETAKIMARRL